VAVVGAEAAHLDVQVAVEPEGGDLEDGVVADVAGEQRLHHAGDAAERGEGGLGARQGTAPLADHRRLGG
jgi:hypothetical protein